MAATGWIHHFDPVQQLDECIAVVLARPELARRILEALGTVAPAHPAPVLDPTKQAAAEQSMWEWYLEWGEITRVAIADRKLLREMGFLNYRRPLADEEPEPEELEAPTSAPAAE